MQRHGRTGRRSLVVLAVMGMWVGAWALGEVSSQSGLRQVSNRAIQTIPQLPARMASRDPMVRAVLVDSLVAIAPEEAGHSHDALSLRYDLSAHDYEVILQQVLPGLATGLTDNDLKHRLLANVAYIASQHRLKGLAPALAEFLRDDPGFGIRHQAIRIAGLTEARDLAPLIAACLGDPRLAFEAERLLVRFKSPLVKPYLIEQLRSGPKGHRFRMVQHLAAIGATDAIEHIEPLLRDPDETLRVWAVRALAELDARGSRDAIFNAMVKDCPPLGEAQRDGIAALLKLDDKRAIPLALTQLTASRLGVRHGLADRIVALEAVTIVPTLIKLLDDPTPVGGDVGTNSSIRRDVIGLLVRLGAREAIPTFHRILNERNEFLARAAGDALARFRAHEAIPDLLRRLGSENYGTWTSAASALAQFGDPGAAEAVVARLKRANSHSHRVETLNALALALHPEVRQRLESIRLSPGEGLKPEAYARALSERIGFPITISAQALKSYEESRAAWPAGSAWPALRRLVAVLNYSAHKCSMFIEPDGTIRLVTNEEAFGLWETYFAIMRS